MAIDKIHEKVIRHVVKKVCGKEKEEISKDDAKKIFDYLEKTYPHEIAEEIAEDWIEHDKIKGIVKTYKNTLRIPKKEALAELALIHAGKTRFTTDEREYVAKKIDIKKHGRGGTLSPISLLKELGAIEEVRRRFKKRSIEISVKKPEIIEALVEWYQERDILPKHIDIQIPPVEKIAEKVNSEGKTVDEPQIGIKTEPNTQTKKSEETKKREYKGTQYGKTPREALVIYYAQKSGKKPEEVSDEDLVALLRQEDINHVADDAKNLLKAGNTDAQKRILIEFGIKEILSKHNINPKSREKRLERDKQTAEKSEISNAHVVENHEKNESKAFGKQTTENTTEEESETTKIIRQIMEKLRIEEVNTTEELEKVLLEVEKLRDGSRKNKKRNIYANMKTILTKPHVRQIAALAAVLEKNVIDQKDIEDMIKALKMRSKHKGNIYLHPFKVLGIIDYNRDPRQGKIYITSKKEHLLKYLIEKYTNIERTRTAIYYLRNLQPYTFSKNDPSYDYLYRVKSAAELAFGKNQRDAFLHVLLNPYNVMIHRKGPPTPDKDIVMNQYLRRIIIENLAKNEQFLRSLEKNALIKRVPESLRKILWVGKVAKIMPVDTKMQKVVWVDKDTAEAWREFFKRYRDIITEKKRKRKPKKRS